jgi:glucose/arabinose dehydrogenase
MEWCLRLALGSVFGIALMSVGWSQLPADFYDTELLNLEQPLGITFDDNGQGYIWEQNGLVHILDTNDQRLATPLIDLREEVSVWNDNGLNGLCLDNDFLRNGYLYLYYVVDMHHYWHYGSPEYHPDTTITNKATFGRLVRYTADAATGFRSIVPGSRHVLLGQAAADGIPILYPFHGLGTVLMATDGTLLLSSGEVTGGIQVGIGNEANDEFVPDAIDWGIITPDEDLGSYRAQYLGSANGKVLRIDPETGEGLASNPYYTSAAPRSPLSRIWASGFRNPYRMILRPNTGSHYAEDGQPGTLLIADVGNASWEELNVCDQPGMNFGWPVYEGISRSWKFLNLPVPDNPLAPNPIGSCEDEYLDFRQLLAQPRESGPYLPPNPCAPTQPIPEDLHPQYARLPLVVYSNARYNPPARTAIPGWRPSGNPREVFIDSTETTGVEGERFAGFSAMAGCFYTADAFPEHYHAKLFTIDYSNWIRVWDLDEGNELRSVDRFHDNSRSICHLALNPRNGALYYTNTFGNLHKVSYGGNPAPVARISVDKDYGPGPLTVQFSAADSYDPDGSALSFSWDFGDGQTAVGEEVSHRFEASGSAPTSYTVTMTATDPAGASQRVSRIISLNNTPPQVRISTFQDGDRYPLGFTSLLSLQAEVSDAEHGPEELSYEWRTFLHHNDHFHPEPAVYEPESFMLVSPVGCEDEIYYYRVQLTVKDAAGLSTVVTQRIYPDCGPAFVEGLHLSGDYASRGIRLLGETTFEENLASIELQRSSDFYHFRTIAELAPRNAASQAHTYEWLDEQPLSGANVYRLKVRTAEGAYTYSNIINLTYPQPAVWQVFPNPTDYQLSFELKAATASVIRIELYQINGARFLSSSSPAIPGQEWREQLLVYDLPPGVYAYRLLDGEQTYTGRVVVR